MTILIIIFIITIFIAILALQHFFHDIFFMGPYVPTVPARVKQIIKFANLNENDIVCDLGCGDARILIEAAQSAKCKCFGYEISWIPYILAKMRTKNYSNIKILRQNFMKVSLNNYSAVFIYLLPIRNYEVLEDKLYNELEPGSKVIVEAFPFKKWKPSRVESFDDGGKVYIYEK